MIAVAIDTLNPIINKIGSNGINDLRYHCEKGVPDDQ